MENPMKHFLTLTDTNSRQYNFLIPEQGIKINSVDDNCTVFQNADSIVPVVNCIAKKNVVVINGSSAFNTNFIVSVQYQALPDDAF